MKQFILNISNIYIYLFISHPLLLYLIMLVLNMVLYIYYSNPYLCDGDNLEELNNKLTLLCKYYNDSNKEYEQYSSLLKELSNRPDCVKDNGIERYLIIKKDSKNIETVSILFKIRIIEASIMIKDSNFVSTIKMQWLEYF